MQAARLLRLILGGCCVLAPMLPLLKMTGLRAQKLPKCNWY